MRHPPKQGFVASAQLPHTQDRDERKKKGAEAPFFKERLALSRVHQNLWLIPT
jgi:hypothetical protein